jgi:PAS domain S-box-containing protein
LIELIGYSREKLTEKEVWKLDVFRDIIPNEKKFSELKKKEFVCYPNLTVKTESGKTINIEFNSNMYSEKEKSVIQCFIHENKI